MKILLVEDQKLIASQIITQLNELGYSNVAHKGSSKSALEYFAGHVIDLLIMDIGLAGSPIDGIELSKQMMDRRMTPIIFLSAYSDEHTLRRAQKVEHAGYLVKPCSSRQLFVSIEHAMINHFSGNTVSQSPTTECPLLKGSSYFYVKRNRHYEKVSIVDILWISSTRGGVVIHTIHGKYMLTATLASFERQLNHPSLLRIHKSHIINKNHVLAIGEREVKLRLDREEVVLQCGNTYLTDFKKHFFKLKSD